MRLTQEYLHSILTYEPETGIFKWRVTASNRPAGTIAGCMNRNTGYHLIFIEGKRYQAHRLAWLYIEGYLPENEIDHINRIRNDNRLCNPREVSKTCNMRNRPKQKNNSSGITGVTWDNLNNSWLVHIKINSKFKNLGRFRDFDEAVCHRYTAEICNNWYFCAQDSAARKHMTAIGLIK